MPWVDNYHGCIFLLVNFFFIAVCEIVTNLQKGLQRRGVPSGLGSPLHGSQPLSCCCLYLDGRTLSPYKYTASIPPSGNPELKADKVNGWILGTAAGVLVSRFDPVLI